MVSLMTTPFAPTPPKSRAPENRALQTLRAIRLPTLATMVGVMLVSNPTVVGSTEAETGPTDKVYREYTDAYRNMTKAIDNSARANEVASAKDTRDKRIIFGVLVPMLLIVLISHTRLVRRSKIHNEKMLQMMAANLQLLEQVRDALTKTRVS
jgi:hypothetical protein